LLRVLRAEQGKESVPDLALFTPDISDSLVRIYTKDSNKLFTHLINLEEGRERLLKCRNSLIDTKLALEESVSELLQTKAKARMLEEELRRIRKMSWWQRLLWRS
jgi:hypothetical protein